MPRGLVATPVCLPDDVLRHWKSGADTAEIAFRCGVRESTVANMLPAVLDRARQDAQWESGDDR